MKTYFKKISNILSTVFKTFKQYRWKFTLIIIFGFIMGFSGAFGIGTIIPIFALLTGQETAGLGFIDQTIKGFFSILHVPFTLQTILVLTIILFLVKGVVQFISKYYTEKIVADYQNTVRLKLFTHTLKASWPYLIDQRLGFLEKVVMSDTVSMALVLSQISSLILTVTNFVIYAFFAFGISPIITITTSLFGIVLFFVFHPVLNRVKRIALVIRDSEKTLAHFINENILGSKVIKASAVEDQVSARAKDYLNKYKNDRLRIAFFSNSVGAAFEPISFIFIAFLIIFYHRSPNFQIASFAVIIYLIQKIFSFIQAGQNSVQTIVANVPYVQSINRYNKDIVNHEETKKGGTYSFKESIKFDKVSFTYPNGNQVLHNIDLKINNGEMIGLIGPSGAGKTTIVDLLMHLFTPSSGSITVDGTNLDKIDLKDWRKHIGYMSQEVFLLNDTIENNIRFYDSSLKRDDILVAAQAANILQFIEELPDGLDTVIGERGMKVSGGQRQRIALARVLARKPELLILDEATSSLDNESESLIQESIKSLRGNITILAIAHRLSTIMNVDRLLIMEEGKIVEEGSPEKLLEDQSSRFNQIHGIKK